MHFLLRHTQALIAQVSKRSVCNRHHTLEGRLCRWLVMSLDLMKPDKLIMTHELIAHMLGLRRDGVTDAAHKLQATGVVRYARGHSSYLDRHGLQLRNCPCYAAVKQEYERLLPPVANLQPTYLISKPMPRYPMKLQTRSNIGSPLTLYCWREPSLLTRPNAKSRNGSRAAILALSSLRSA